ncbi:hypothetical protein [Pontibacter saemangeumensis]
MIPARENLATSYGTSVVTLPTDVKLSRWFWWIWLLVIGIISPFFLLTMGTGPYLHSDEFMNLDLGRVILDPKTDWSIAWMLDQQKPVYLFSYVGTVLQELSFEFGGQYGPRVSGLIGALAAATALLGWLIARRTSPNVAILLGLIFLLDPLFVQAFTIGRIDGWPMALCLSSCWILRDSGNYLSKLSLLHVRLLSAGGLATIAFFTWPSAVFLFPLIALELFDVLKKNVNGGYSFQKSYRPVLYFIAGGVVVTLLLLLPIISQLLSQYKNALEGLKANTHGGSSQEKLTILNNAVELLRVLKYTPVMVLIALLVFFKFRQMSLTLAILTVLILMISTLVYINRVQYLLPYFLAYIGSLYHQKNIESSSQWLRMGSLAALLFWSVGLSLGVRTYLAFDTQQERKRELVHQAALSMIGSGEHRVLIPYEFYYSGRSLGWKMYRAYIAYNNPFNTDMLKKILTRVDYAIMRQPMGEFEWVMLEEGWLDKGTIYLYDKPSEAFDGKTTNESRIRNLYSIFRKPYGPYRLFVRNKRISTLTEETQ